MKLKPVMLEALIEDLQNQALEANISAAIIDAFSPIANVTLLENGNYLITITDKKGTTTAEIPVLTKDAIFRILIDFFDTNDIILDGGNAYSDIV